MKLLHYIVIFFFSIGISFAQQIKVTGKVTDAKITPLPGVSVIIKGSTVGTSTDFDGNYAILTSPGDTLVFSYIGFESQEKKVTGKSSIIYVIMEVSAAELEEVIVTAYAAKMQKRILGCSVSTIKSSDRRSGRRKNRKSKASQRQISSVNRTSGVPIRIRGANSITHSGHNKGENNESYKGIVENNFMKVNKSPLSTFSIDVDKASYSNIRRMINNGTNVPVDAVKIEEMINYFDYDYKQPVGDHPFAIHTEYAATPWNRETKLVKIGLKGKEVPQDEIPPSNLVFLIDVSGSMSDANKLPLLKKAFKLLTNQLREKDKVSIVVYAGAAGMILKPTSGANKNEINKALQNLHAGGSTAGGAGIELAYKIAKENFIENGNNRVILATDGDFNVGMSSDKNMKDLIEEKRKSGVFLTCLGFGMGNYKDSKLETLADKGNGNHAYIDTMQEAQRVLGKEFGGTLYTIAKDVKIQVEFNPGKVQAYRLIGYENRLLADEDFIDDTKDAGELGSGHTVTALYEIIPVGVKSKYIRKTANLKYTNATINKEYGDELLTVKFRYKKPQEKKSIEIVHTLKTGTAISTSQDFNFAASVAWFGMKLRNSKYARNQKLDDIIALARTSKEKDGQGYKAEFIRLMNSYQDL